MITSIGPQHLESFGSIENIVKTKFELYESIPDDGMMFLNYDNEYIRNYKGMKPQTGFGSSPDAQFRLLNMDVSASGTVFRVDIPGEGAQEFACLLYTSIHQLCQGTVILPVILSSLQVPFLLFELQGYMVFIRINIQKINCFFLRLFFLLLQKC